MREPKRVSEAVSPTWTISITLSTESDTTTEMGNRKGKFLLGTIGTLLTS